MKLLAKVPFSVLESYKRLLFETGCVSDANAFYDIETYSITEMFANGFEMLRIDQHGDWIMGPMYAVIKLDITKEELTYLTLKSAEVQYEIDNT